MESIRILSKFQFGKSGKQISHSIGENIGMYLEDLNIHEIIGFILDILSLILHDTFSVTVTFFNYPFIAF